MVLYIGDKPVGLMKFIEKKVPKLKFGISIDNLLGDVDAKGNLFATGEPFTLDLAGVKEIDDYYFAYFSFNNRRKLENFHADDATDVRQHAFDRFMFQNDFAKTFTIGITKCNGQNAFEYAFAYTDDNLVPVFANLREIRANSAFAYAFYQREVPDLSKVFPVLEYIEGSSAFNYLKKSQTRVFLLPSVTTIVGATGSYSATFNNAVPNAIFKLPKCTTITHACVFPANTAEIHFGAANQAAIEACEGYSGKFGATNATIYFDL